MEIVTITEARRRLDGALPSYKAKIEYVTPDQALGRNLHFFLRSIHYLL